MILTLTRDLFTDTATLGRLAIIYEGRAYDGRLWTPSDDRTPRPYGFTCEDADRGLAQSMTTEETARVKVPKLTAIGVGRYPVRVAMSPKRGREVLWIDRVTGFGAVQMHRGNDPRDSEGCPLVGLTRDTKAMRIGRSIPAEEWLLARVRECQRRGERVWVEIERDVEAWAGAPLNPMRRAA